MSLFSWPAGTTGSFQEMREALQKGETPLQVSGCLPSQKAYLMNELGNDFAWRLVVAGDDLNAKELVDDLSQFGEEVYFYPAKDLIFYQADLSSNYQLGQRLQVMKLLCEGKGGTIVTTMNGLMNVLPSFKEWRDAAFTLFSGQTVMMDALQAKLVAMGYQRHAVVENPGDFSVRGDIVDIYDFTADNPVRVELFGDEVDEIRSFDGESQRTIDHLEEVIIYPADEFILSPKERESGIRSLKKDYEERYEAYKAAGNYETALNLKQTVGLPLEQLQAGVNPGNLYSFLPYFDGRQGSLLDALEGKQVLVVIDDPTAVAEKGKIVEDEWSESSMNRLEKGYMLARQAKVLHSVSRVWTALKKLPLLVTAGPFAKVKELPVKKAFALQVSGVSSYKNNMELLMKDLKKWRKAHMSVVLLYASHSKALRMADYLQQNDINAVFAERGTGRALPGMVTVTVGKLHKGFSYPFADLVVLTETDMYGAQPVTRKKATGFSGQKISSLSELKIGDYVVHENYGLGMYLGIVRKVEGRVARDYIHVEYGDNSSLYVPAMQFELIQKYASSDKEGVKLSHLYGNEWKRTKARVQKAVESIAQELVDLYAVRQEKEGFACGPDTFWQREFEESFPYNETPDQLKAIADVKQDMESHRIMDRLICGDVGFGKTEIALRAAFKAVQEGLQVVFLVPTTILCQQHYNTFVSRLSEYPVRVDSLSRFCTPAQSKKTLEDAKAGKVDILIGTHRVLSKDVELKNLGLLIIDEEQRFGVTHKEKIKQMKKDVDVLTLTATPIPRTLHMSLVGVRDMSTLTQAPQERLPIQTYVCEYRDELVREAIAREVARGGQVYYVYNRVSDIVRETENLQQLLPNARIAYAHGQMSERQLEKIMLAFISGDIDVLVSTTIIETGLDIPNVNTIIIRRAERFGLSQLYQLRGRVGRSNRVAYAFILYERDGNLTEVAEKRLNAIRQFTELGSGVKIAMEDLEIRGAGNLLGTSQHGHLEEVGYDLYCKMLNEAVLRLKGELAEEESFSTRMELPLDAYIPNTYITHEGLMLDVYKRIMDLSTEDEYLDMQMELIDRFGEIPEVCNNLLYVAWMKGLAHSEGIEEVKVTDREIRLLFRDKAPINPENIPQLLQKHVGKLQIIAKPRPTFVYSEKRPQNMGQGAMCEMLKTLLQEIKILLVDGKSDIVS